MVPGVKDGMFLPSPVYEITLKDDAAGDPLIVPSALVALGIVDGAIMDEMLDRNAAVMDAVRAMFTARGRICGTSRSSGAWTNRAVP